jgi:hypothetical protein
MNTIYNYGLNNRNIDCLYIHLPGQDEKDSACFGS